MGFSFSGSFFGGMFVATSYCRWAAAVPRKLRDLKKRYAKRQVLFRSCA